MNIFASFVINVILCVGRYVRGAMFREERKTVFSKLCTVFSVRMNVLVSDQKCEV
jgi:hypothetical protein